MRGLATKTLSVRSSRASTSASTCGGAAPIPGSSPSLHLDHIYYEGQVDVRSVELPRTRQALMASDHLPLVANLRVGSRPVAD